jgi:aquaporin Z
MRAYVTEFIGTFFLVFTIGMSVVGNVPMAAVAIGSILMVMVFMGGHISGAHYNPAVTLAVFLRGKLPAKDLLPYWISQLIAASAAGGVVWAILHKGLPSGQIPKEMILSALLNEFIYTFALALVVLNVATAKGTEGNSFYGLAIGFTVTAAALAGGGVSRGAYNPAVGLGLTVMGASLANIWIWIVGPLAGGALAAFVFKFQHPGE